MPSSIGTYEKDGKSYPTINLVKKGADPKAKWGGFSFGLSKARLILANIEDIKTFVEKYGGDSGQQKGGADELVVE